MSGGKWEKNCSNASNPPADAPMPTMQKAALSRLGPGPATSLGGPALFVCSRCFPTKLPFALGLVSLAYCTGPRVGSAAAKCATSAAFNTMHSCSSALMAS